MKLNNNWGFLILKHYFADELTPVLQMIFDVRIDLIGRQVKSPQTTSAHAICAIKILNSFPFKQINQKTAEQPHHKPR